MRGVLLVRPFFIFVEHEVENTENRKLVIYKHVTVILRQEAEIFVSPCVIKLYFQLHKIIYM